MQNAPTLSIMDELTDFLASNPSSQEILAYELPAALQSRAIDLLERNGEGELSYEEQQEMYDFMRINQILSLWQAKTRLKLQQSSE
jgi:hypothetical protein